MAGGIHTYVTLIGKVSISDDGEGNVDGVYLPNSNLPLRDDRECPVIAETASQIDEYLAGKRMSFDVPFVLNGTDFQKKVWNEIGKIPYGETASYKDLAGRIGSPGAYRAVGNACNSNPVPLIIPCHRVVASNGIGGFSNGLVLKRKIMGIEGIEL
ncbi:MAG: methylated-DNA--[protein]-cysteine S-methyltransferase [Candidatus Methanoplasma sp.]|jgi:methylated-DNA-[protein]-cysteine S-methyltransferase|nr:methylated-DNA--[protein]-cysteine S-methyltransferase [Candidatus Methanoplasma sp.]